MRLHLPDNAREAFQFLALGVGALLAMRLAVVGIGALSEGAGDDALAEACAPYRNGYPLLQAHALVVGGAPVILRLAAGALFALLCGVLGAVIPLPFGIRGGERMRRRAVLGGRIGLVLGAAWGIYCTLCLPPAFVEVAPNSGLTTHEAPAFLGMIVWPLSERTQHYAWAELETVATLSTNGPSPCGAVTGVSAMKDSELVELARPMPPDEGCETHRAQQQVDADRLVRALAPYLH